MYVKRRSGRCCGRKGPCGNDFVAIATIATSLIVIVIYYVSPSVEKAQKEKVDMSRSQSQFSKKEKVAPIISDVEKERLRQQIDEFDSA